MRDVSAKEPTLRIARAQAMVSMPAAILKRLRAGTLEKGNALEMARAAGILAAKRTPELLPLCHPLAIEHAAIEYRFSATTVTVEATIRVTAKTGVEMEALTAASIAALTLYDMLKPHAGTDLSIDQVLLLSKQGGKSDFERRRQNPTKTPSRKR